MKTIASFVFMLAATTTATAAPIYPTFGAGFIQTSIGARTSAGRLDATATFDSPLTGVLTFWHFNEDGWPLDFDGVIAEYLPVSEDPGPGQLIFWEKTLVVSDVTTIGFARFVGGPTASALYVRDFDYTPTNTPTPVPEPTTMALVGLGLLAAARKRFR